MLTGRQIRAARAMLGWTATELAERAGTTRNTVQRLEQEDGIPQSRSKTLFDLRKALENAGIEFLENSASVGVIFHTKI